MGGLHSLRDFAGESANASGQSSAAVQESFNNMRIIVSLGWSIYPAGYFLGTLTTGASSEALNVTYNIADFVNKIAFVLACWSCAKTDSEGAKERIRDLETQIGQLNADLGRTMQEHA